VMQAARAQIPATDARLKELLERSRCDSSLLMSALQRVQEAARVVVHFHPDRLDARGITVAESLLQSGLYRNQFETGLSNGGLTAFRGGMRDVWGLGLFGGVYQRPEVTPRIDRSMGLWSSCVMPMVHRHASVPATFVCGIRSVIVAHSQTGIAITIRMSLAHCPALRHSWSRSVKRWSRRAECWEWRASLSRSF